MSYHFTEEETNCLVSNEKVFPGTIKEILRFKDSNGQKNASVEPTYSIFYEDFHTLVSISVPKERVTFNYTHPVFDSEEKYIVDCRINGMPKPLYIFAIPNDSKCKDVMISMYQFERWGLKYNSISIFEDQETINRRVLAKFSDIGEKQFSSLLSNKERIKNYLSEQIENSK
ncbi:MAG: hypothetical protein PF693_15400 [Spirochaetia bacterium]|nr:hypothetical protein [Spirochaetia bacterium]